MGRLFLGDLIIMIAIENLTVSYQRKPAVHHVDMQFDDASMWAIFGPNGAGKSTLLKAVMGLLKCNTGKVSWQGIARRDIAHPPPQAAIDPSPPLAGF